MKEEKEVSLPIYKLDSVIGYAINGLNPRIDFRLNRNENVLNAFHESRTCLVSILEILKDIHPDRDAILKIENVLNHYCTYGYREGTHDRS